MLNNKKKEMKTIFRFSICMVIMAITFMACGSDDTIGGKKEAKLSPPSWIHGSWGDEDGYVEVFRFTSNDIFQLGVSLKTIYGWTAGGAGVSIKETKNTSSLYEITITATDGKEKASAYYSFKKGDGNYIEAGWEETGDPIASYEKLYKIK